MSRPPCLELQDLWFAYGERAPVLRGISLTIEPGSFVALVGPNGSGKTTLVKHFNGLLRPTRGDVLLDGETITGRSVGALARTIGYVFQNPDHQIFNASTRAEIAAGPRNLGLDEAEVASRTTEALTRFDLLPFADRQPALLSFGLRRKVSFAAVYAMQPAVLILDEPTLGLDRRNVREMMQIVVDLHQSGHTILLITHDMPLVAEYVPHCLILQAGQVLAYEETRAIFRRVEMLRQVHLRLPQVAELSRRLQPFGMPGDILTVAEFCAAYEP